MKEEEEKGEKKEEESSSSSGGMSRSMEVVGINRRRSTPRDVCFHSVAGLRGDVPA